MCMVNKLGLPMWRKEGGAVEEDARPLSLAPAAVGLPAVSGGQQEQRRVRASWKFGAHASLLTLSNHGNFRGSVKCTRLQPQGGKCWGHHTLPDTVS